MPRNILHHFVFGKFHFDFWGFCIPHGIEIMQLALLRNDSWNVCIKGGRVDHFQRVVAIVEDQLIATRI